MDIKVDQNTVVVFDLDDTLYNEIEYLKSAYRHIAQNIDEDSWPKLYTLMFSLYRTGNNVFDYLVQQHSCNKDVLLELYRNHQPSIQPFPGVLEFFRNIRRCNGKIAIVTDGRSRTQRNKIQSLGIGSLVDHVVISEELGTEKPDKNNFLAVEKQFNRSKYFYVADNVRKDFDAPRSLGWQGILITDNGLNIHTSSDLADKIDALNLGVILSIEDIRVVP